MNIAITFRHLESSDAIKAYAEEKIGKLQKFLHRPMQANITLSVEKNYQVVEVKVSAGGEHFEAKESSENMYASIDRVTDKLQSQMLHAKDAKVSAKRSAIRTGEFARTQTGDFEPEYTTKNAIEGS